MNFNNKNIIFILYSILQHFKTKESPDDLNWCVYKTFIT